MARQSSQRSTPYFRHIKEDDLDQSTGPQSYTHAFTSGATPDTTVNSPKRTSLGGLNTQVQKSFPGPPGPSRQEGESNRRSWDGPYQPDVADSTEPRWIPGGADGPSGKTRCVRLVCLGWLLGRQGRPQV